MDKEKSELELKIILNDTVIKHIVGCLNTTQGEVYIGKINFEGELNIIELQRKVKLSVQEKIRPDASEYITIIIENIEGNKYSIKAKVERGHSKPYYIAERGMKIFGVYIKKKKMLIPIVEEKIKKMIEKTGEGSFEELRSLDQELTFGYLNFEFEKSGIRLDDAKKKELGIIGNDGLYTNLGFLLSDKNDSKVEINVFDSEKNKMKDMKIFKGSLLAQRNDIEIYLSALNTREESKDAKYDSDITEKAYPEKIISDLLNNALIHRDYFINKNIVININEKKMEFLSPGQTLPTGLEATSGELKMRNKKLMNIFSILKLADNHGETLREIREFYKKNGILFDLSEGKGMYKVSIPNIYYYIEKEAEKNNLSKIQEKIFNFLKNGKDYSPKELEEYLELPYSNIVAALTRLTELGMVKKDKEGTKTYYKIIKKLF